MLLRSYIVKTGRPLRRFTSDVQSSTGMNPGAEFGTRPLPGDQVPMYDPPAYKHFGEQNLKNWFDAVTAAFPY